jgi:hypothetical protein
MGTHSAPYEPYAWWLARERIGSDLRDYFAAPQELPSRILALVETLSDAAERDRFRTRDAPSLLNKLDAIEGNQLLRACRTRLRTLCRLQRSGSST